MLSTHNNTHFYYYYFCLSTQGNDAQALSPMVRIASNGSRFIRLQFSDVSGIECQIAHFLGIIDQIVVFNISVLPNDPFGVEL